MKKYKLNTDNKPKIPSDKCVENSKDFGRLFHDYEKYTKRPKKPIYKDPKLFLLIIVLGLLAYIIFTENNDNKKDNNKTEQLDK